MTKSNPVSLTGEATFHEIFVKDSYHAWAKLLWQDDGRVIILSDYGVWSYFWGHRGEGVSVEEFLSDLDEGYMGSKMLAGNLMVFSLEKTVKGIREEIADLIREGSIEDANAIFESNLCKCLEDEDFPFDEWMKATELDEPWESARKEICPEWANFWSRLWVPLIKPQLERMQRGNTDD